MVDITGQAPKNHGSHKGGKHCQGNASHTGGTRHMSRKVMTRYGGGKRSRKGSRKGRRGKKSGCGYGYGSRNGLMGAPLGGGACGINAIDLGLTLDLEDQIRGRAVVVRQSGGKDHHKYNCSQPQLGSKCL